MRQVIMLALLTLIPLAAPAQERDRKVWFPSVKAGVEAAKKVGLKSGISIYKMHRQVNKMRMPRELEQAAHNSIDELVNKKMGVMKGIAPIFHANRPGTIGSMILSESLCPGLTRVETVSVLKGWRGTPPSVQQAIRTSGKTPKDSRMRELTYQPLALPDSLGHLVHRLGMVEFTYRDNYKPSVYGYTRQDRQNPYKKSYSTRELAIEGHDGKTTRFTVENKPITELLQKAGSLLGVNRGMGLKEALKEVGLIK